MRLTKLSQLIRKISLKAVFFIFMLSQPGFHVMVTAQDKGDATVFTIANILQSNMVVQQSKPMHFWGTAPAGDVVTIQADWMRKPVLARADGRGNWIGKIPVPKATPKKFSSHTITVIHRNDTTIQSNILIGEVWMCSGQSNMTFLMGKGRWPGVVLNSKQEIAEADYPFIRLFQVGTHWDSQPVPDCTGKWSTCSPETVDTFSAVAYYFGRELFNKLQVPIGLVANGMPATGCQAFASKEVLEADPVLKEKYVAPFLNKPMTQKEHLFARLQRPAIIYNGMIHPIRHLSIRGFIWFQGAANHKDGALYTRLCTAMLEGWRRDFDQGALPFYLVQIAPYDYKEKDPHVVAVFREAQEAILSAENTGMVVTTDVGDVNDIHFPNKKPVGLRLAKVALHQTYHVKKLTYEGPRFSKFKVSGSIVKVSFIRSTLGTGLQTNDRKPPKHFFIAGKDRVFYPATTRIVNNRVWLTSEKVVHPVAVRYAFSNHPVTNFENQEGLPAWPFRTDRWSE